MPRKMKRTGKMKRNKRCKTRKNTSRRYRRRYRGGCDKCVGSNEKSWLIRGGNPEFSSDKISQDIYNYKTDSSFYPN